VANGFKLLAPGSGSTVLATSTNGGVSSPEPVFTDVGLLSVGITGPTAITTGSQAKFQLTVTNDTLGTTAISVQLGDRLPPGTAFVSATGGCTYAALIRTVSCPEGDIGPQSSANESVTISFPSADYDINTALASSANGGSSLSISAFRVS
jgi:uncharacterized repeat protein (TIGR01451 family)